MAVADTECFLMEMRLLSIEKKKKELCQMVTETVVLFFPILFFSRYQNFNGLAVQLIQTADVFFTAIVDLQKYSLREKRWQNSVFSSNLENMDQKNSVILTIFM